MRNETPFNINDETGEYTATRPLSADDILLQAWLIRKEQVKRGTKIGSPTETKEYLKAELGAREREAFGIRSFWTPGTGFLNLKFSSTEQ